MNKEPKRGYPLPTHIIVSGLLLLIQFVLLAAVVYDYTLASTAAYFLTTVLGMLTVIIIINRWGNPDHKISWIVFILVFPVFGITVFLLWGGGRALPHIKKRMKTAKERYSKHLCVNEDVLNTLKYKDMLHFRQAQYLTRESGYPVYGGTATEYFSPIEDMMPRLLEELNNAEKYIFIEFFILAEGQMWDRIHKILTEKAKAGVEIKIIFDDFGSIKRQSKGFVSRLKSEGIEVAVFNPINPFMNIFMNNRNHRKIIVIDGKTAFTGGFNIGDEYCNYVERFGYWKDSAVIIKGSAVKSFLCMFCSMWEFTTRKPIKMENYICDFSVESDGFVIPYSDDPIDDKNPAEGIYMQILSTAQRYVYIATPYLIIDNAMKDCLMMAAKSGIDVRIAVPHIPDKWYVDYVTKYNYLELLEAGVKIYEYTPGFIHSKLFVSDDSVATVGTVNMDYRSFDFLFECGVWIANCQTVMDIKEDFLSIFDRSEEIKIEAWRKRPIADRLKQAFLHIFAPFM